MLYGLRVRSSVGHGEESWLGVGLLEVLVGKLLTVDGLAAGTLDCHQHWFVRLWGCSDGDVRCHG